MILCPTTCHAAHAQLQNHRLRIKPGQLLRGYRQGEGVYRSFSAASGLLNSNLLGGADVLPHTHESEMQFHLLACLDGLYGYVLLILRPGKWAGITQRNQRSQKNFRPAQMEDLPPNRHAACGP